MLNDSLMKVIKSEVGFVLCKTYGQSYEQFTLIIYDSRVVIWENL